MWKIYKHIFPNGKIYIGQTKCSLSKRFQDGDGYITQPLMAKAIKKYGWDNVITEILEDNIPSQEEANQLEIKYIAEYNSRNPEKGYNVGIGGGIVNKYDDEQIYQLWKDNKSYAEIMAILNCSKDTIGRALKRRNVSKEERIERGITLSKKNRTNCKPVNQYDLNNNYIQTFKSITDANRALGKAPHDSHICAVCKGNRKQAYGFKWAYAQ